MKLSTLEFVPSRILTAPQILYRIQRLRARAGTLSVGPLRVAPAHLLAGRFDLKGVPVGYFAETPETAAYETFARRETLHVSAATLAQRGLLCVKTTRPLTMLDLRPHTGSWPVLQSLRFGQTQALAADAAAEGFDGVMYHSVQHFSRDCFAVFGSALDAVKLVWRQHLVERMTGNVHQVAAEALRGSQLPLVP